MLVDGDGGPPRVPGTSGRLRLDVAVADLYADLRLAPLLQRLLAQSRGLLGAVAGSISVVDGRNGRYAKIAESGARCQLGRSFSLDEGATGQAFARRTPVVIDDYSHLPVGHLPKGHPAGRGAAAAVPLWWRGEVIGVNVAFAGRHRRFTTAEVDDLELLTQSVASALVRAGEQDPSLAALIREQGAAGGGVPPVVTEVGTARPVPAAVRSAAVDIVALAGRTAAPHADRVHVAVVYRPQGLRLLVQTQAPSAGPGGPDPLGMGAHSWQELVAVAGGAIAVEHVPGWGTLLRADLPYAPAPSTLTPREDEVLRLLAGGCSDREVAARLVISPKTVEKHVGAVLRKTGAASRTAAVVRALERGWLPSGEA